MMRALEVANVKHDGMGQPSSWSNETYQCFLAGHDVILSSPVICMRYANSCSLQCHATTFAAVIFSIAWLQMSSPNGL